MANTTNYNWETPDDTDLVKDGAAAIRTLGSSIDTTTKALNPSTTLGDIEYRSSTANTNTRLAIGTTGQVLTVAGGVPTWATSDDANAIQNAIVDAKGDIVAASAADTPARLAVGTDNQRLIAASGEATGLKYVSDTQNTVIDDVGDLLYGTAADTVGKLAIGSTGNVLTVAGGVPTWAAPAAGSSGLNLISTTTWSGAASQSFNNVFTSTYTNYRLIINVNDPTSDGTVRMRLRVSGTDNTGANYMSVMDGMRSDGVRSSFVSSADTSFLMSEIDAGTSGNRYGYSVDLFKPQTNTLKTGQVVNEGMTTAGLVYSVYGGLTFTTAIQADGFTLFTSAGNFSGTCSIYGYGK